MLLARGGADLSGGDMTLLWIVVGLCLLLPSLWLAGRILWRWRTWTRVEAKVFRITKDKAAKMTYLVDGRQRTAVTKWAFGAEVADVFVVRYDPEQPLRHEIDRPVWRAVRLVALALVASAGVGFIIDGARTGSLWDDSLDVPWFVWIGLGLVSLAIASTLATHQRGRRGWQQADGAVTAVREHKIEDRDGSVSVTYRVAYEFVDTTGTPRTATAETWSRSHEKGQTLPVRYDPDNPSRSDISTPRVRTTWWAAAAALSLLGVGSAALGWLAAIRQDAW
ncbi:DUF3592 domain-containing protein [Nocardioides piscis]|uniref:DUF3592 domain-containing protein n=1 Tax=Nocardioides piscis TaxID=2714938 RepID=A0A6G7YDH4_9ACTN|nr:DUF3592 domain-containing protein [Nocardioides piscis]QIK74691.1 DUF3592 domain-containing protein [Nocardioides piscis]